MSTGSGELATVRQLNAVWRDRGHCIRLSQRKGDTPVISDLIFSVNGETTYSIEVKKISLSRKKSPVRGILPASYLSFGGGCFSVATGKNVEIPHQLERQVEYSRRMGWIPLVLVYLSSGTGVKTQKYLFDSAELLRMKNAGKKSLSSKDFDRYHKRELYAHIFYCSSLDDDKPTERIDSARDTKQDLKPLECAKAC